MRSQIYLNKAKNLISLYSYMCVYTEVLRQCSIKMSHVQCSVREEKKNVNERPTATCVRILEITLTIKKTVHNNK